MLRYQILMSSTGLKMAASSTAELKVGQNTIAMHDLASPIGNGAVGVVYLAKDYWKFCGRKKNFD